jgi:hypothetical protein
VTYALLFAHAIYLLWHLSSLALKKKKKKKNSIVL